MFLTDLSIKRPVVSMVMSIVMVMFGILVFFEIPTNELPDIDRPVVSVQTDYKGASAQVIDTQITQKIDPEALLATNPKSINKHARVSNSERCHPYFQTVSSFFSHKICNKTKHLCFCDCCRNFIIY